ncbi:MAG: hypothetical protein ACYCO3_08065 [Mycobacteriales bacterium]
MSREVVLSYELFEVRDLSTWRPGRRLGVFDTFDAALAERDRVVAAEAEAAGGPVLVRHALVGPGNQGPRTVHQLTTCLGADRITTERGEPSAERTIGWLTQIRAATRTGVPGS